MLGLCTAGVSNDENQETGTNEKSHDKGHKDSHHGTFHAVDHVPDTNAGVEHDDH